MMELIFLGTSGAMPTLERSTTCICLVRDGEILMFDAGEGAQISYLKSNLGWNKKMKIFVTHLHGDHCIGILGFLQTMTLQNRTEPVEIYGPEGIEELIAANTKIMNFGLSFPVLITPINEATVVSEEKYQVHACEAEHSVPTFSFLFEEKEKKMLAQKVPPRRHELDIFLRQQLFPHLLVLLEQETITQNS